MSISWAAIRKLHEADLDLRRVRCRDGLDFDCPLDVFEERFLGHHGDEEFGTMYRASD